MEMWEENQDRKLLGKKKERWGTNNESPCEILKIIWDEVIIDVSKFIKEAIPICLVKADTRVKDEDWMETKEAEAVNMFSYLKNFDYEVIILRVIMIQWGSISKK